jgi:hypothetical protein
MKAAGVTLDSIEIGNEPDLYGNKVVFLCVLFCKTRICRQPWNVTIFVDQYVVFAAAGRLDSVATLRWTEFATNVTLTGAIEPGPGPKFFGPSFANVVHDADSFSALGVFTHGILDSPAGALLRTCVARLPFSCALIILSKFLSASLPMRVYLIAAPFPSLTFVI